MRLYARDFSVPLTSTEKLAFEEEIAFEKRKEPKCNVDAPRFAHPDSDVRNFLWHAQSMFPNNYLNPVSIKQADLESLSAAYASALDSVSKERDIQSYIRDGEKWYIPGALYKEYNFGNHDAYLFPEQALGSEYVADYMLLGKNSDGYSIVLVEFENVNCRYLLTTSNTETEYVRNGLTQIRDWKLWMDSNRDYFLRSSGLANKEITVPTTRIYYLLVVGRRELMTQPAREIRSRTMYDTPNLKIITYDRIADNILKLNWGY